MASRRQIRETVVQFLYCADLGGAADPATLREPFWHFVTEAGRRSLHQATLRTVLHLTHGRDERVHEFQARMKSAAARLSAWPEADGLSHALSRAAELEESWTRAYAALERLPRSDDKADGADGLSAALAAFFAVDRELSAARQRFFDGLQDYPALRGPLEAVAASMRRLQRISERLRMAEEPAKFPEQADLTKLRESEESLRSLRQQTDTLVDAVLARKESIDAALAAVVENFAPERIDPVDRAVLRLGAYELLHTTTPPKVAINEAIELARCFGTTDSHRFVNGVLDRIARQGV